MKLFAGITAAVISVATLSIGTMTHIPYSNVAVAADNLMTRNVWCANEDVNRWESEHFQFIWGKTVRIPVR